MNSSSARWGPTRGQPCRDVRRPLEEATSLPPCPDKPEKKCDTVCADYSHLASVTRMFAQLMPLAANRLQLAHTGQAHPGATVVV